MKKEKKIQMGQIEGEIKALPPERKLNKFFYNSVFQKSHYMFYRKVMKGVYVGYCSCGAEVCLAKAQSGKEIVCSKCGEVVKLRNVIYNKEIKDTGYFAYLQKTSYGVLHRIFTVYQETEFVNDTVKIKYHYYEEQRDLLRSPEIVQKWHNIHAWAPENGPYVRWINGRKSAFIGYYNQPIEEKPIYLYPSNIKEVTSKFPEYKYSQLNVASRHFTLNAIDYLQTYVKYPQLEFLIKLKFYRLANDFLMNRTSWNSHIRFFTGKERTLFDFVKTNDKKTVKYIQKHDLGFRQIDALTEIRQARRPVTIGLIGFYISMENAGVRRGLERMTISKYALYLLWRRNKKNYPRSREFIQDYNDYVSWGIELGYDMTDTKYSKPKDFKYAHDVTANAYEEYQEKLREKAKKVAERKQRAEEKKRKYVLEKLKCQYEKILSFRSNGLCIVVPTTAEEIKEEGRLQQHCVGSYVNRVAEGRSVIAFIRQTTNIDVPYYTVELNPIKDFALVQCRAKNNGGTNEKVERFLKSWERSYTKKLKEIKEAQ